MTTMMEPKLRSAGFKEKDNNKGDWKKAREEEQRGEGEENEGRISSGGCWNRVNDPFREKLVVPKKQPDDEPLKAGVFECGKWRTAKLTAAGSE
jgi:hypothetical protein